MIKNDLLQSFQLVAELGGISKAAEKKSLSVMAISKQMSNLEAIVGQPLFERSGRKMRLTEFGKDFQEEAKKVLAAQQSMQNWLADKSGMVAGTLRVLTQSVEIYQETIFPWLAEFMERYPELNLELDIKEKLIDIKEDEYDVFWGIGSYLGERSPNLKQRKLWQNQYGVFASPGYIQKHGSPNSLDDLEQHYVIGYLYNQPSNVLVLQDNEPVYKFLKQRVSSVAGLFELAKSGLGIINAAPDSKIIREALQNNELVPLLEDNWWQNAELYAYFHNVRNPQPKVKAFIDFFVAKKTEWD